MKTDFLLIVVLLSLLSSCRQDNSHQDDYSTVPRSLALEFSTYVGTKTAEDKISNYIYDLTFLLFKQTETGTYVLNDSRNYLSTAIDALENVPNASQLGYTEVKRVVFNDLTSGIYTIIATGNVYGKPILTYDDIKMTWIGRLPNEPIDKVYAVIAIDSIPNELFYGRVADVVVNASSANTQSIILSREVGMLELILDGLPAGVIDSARITMTNLTNTFAMDSIFSGTQSENKVYTINGATSDTLQLMAFPTVAGVTSSVKLILYRKNNDPITITTLPTQQIKPNTINRLVATVDSQDWTVNLNIELSIQTEWKIDTEPPVVVE